MRKKDMIEKLKELDQFIENVSSLQKQLLKELGYTESWEYVKSQSPTPFRTGRTELCLVKLPPKKFKVFITDFCNKREEEFDSMEEAKEFIIALSQHNGFLFKINDGDWTKPEDIK